MTEETNEITTRAGHVAVVGPANAGKSTLMNRLVGEELAIVTPKAQTTWRRVAGILTRRDAQIILLDTPGLIASSTMMHRALAAEVRRAVKDADVLLVVVDGTVDLKAWLRDGIRELMESGIPVHVALNKADLLKPEEAARAHEQVREAFGISAHEISARTGEHVESLLERIVQDLPRGPFLYPEDEIAIEPVRFFVSEMVREAIFELYDQEIPYGAWTRTEDFRQGSGSDRTYIQVTVYVERSSQKGILIGKKGSAIRSLGQRARERIEHFLGEPVYLDLWVKVLPRWRKKRATLQQLGFTIPDDDSPHRM